jgi:hypothetical protein
MIICILNVFKLRVHCTENLIYLYPEMNLRCLVPNSYIHVSLSDLYFPRFGLPIWLQKIGRLILGIYCINRRQIHECENWETEH